MVCALHRPGHGDQGPRGRHPAGEAADRPGRHSGDPGGPARVLGDPVGLAEQIGREAIEAGAVAREERGVVQVLAQQRVRQPQHHREVGVGADGMPLGPDLVRGVVADRADADEFGPRLDGAAVPARRLMRADAALVDPGVLGRQSAESDHEAGMLDDRGPGVDRADHRAHRAHDARHDHARRPKAVIGDLVDEAAIQVEEAGELGARVVEPARAAPARAAVDGLVAVFPLDPFELAGHQVERPVPANLDERLHAPERVVGARPALQPRLAHRGPGDAAIGVDRIGQGPDEGRGIGVPGERRDADQPAVHRLGGERPPMARPESGPRPVRHVRSPSSSGLS